MTRSRSAIGIALVSLLVGTGLIVGAAGAQETPPEPATDIAYTMLGRGYAAIFGYPADEVPGGGEEEEPEAPGEGPPDQTCPEGQRGVPEEVQARLDVLTDTSDVEPVEGTESEVPSPRGQPIKFDFGLADTSLRSDPGSHSIASFFYVDLGGGQDPWTSAETDGYASGHVREVERCGQPYFGEPGDAQDVHVISRAIEGPYAYAFNQTQRPVLPGGVTMRESITVAEMDGREGPIRGKVASIVEGVSVGAVEADQVVSVVEYVTDGTEGGTTLKAFVDVVGLSVGGTPLELTSGAPPVDVGGTMVGIAAPDVRRKPDGAIQVTVGGLYVGGEFANPLGLQAKQAVFVGGVWYDVSTSTFPAFDTSFPQPPASQEAPPSGFSSGTTSAPAFSSAPPPVSAAPPLMAAPPATAGEAPAVAAPVQVAGASTRLGVYRAPPHVAAPILVLLVLLTSAGTAVFVWSRHRYPEIRAALTVPMFRWLDYGYRAFMRG